VDVTWLQLKIPSFPSPLPPIIPADNGVAVHEVKIENIWLYPLHPIYNNQLHYAKLLNVSTIQK